jgi:hypothetical protein
MNWYDIQRENREADRRLRELGIKTKPIFITGARGYAFGQHGGGGSHLHQARPADRTREAERRFLTARARSGSTWPRPPTAKLGEAPLTSPFVLRCL